MTASLAWKPTASSGGSIATTDTPTFLTLLERSGFRLPHTVDHDDYEVLTALAAAWAVLRGDEQNPFSQIIDLIHTFDSVDLELTN